jgi:hypothetical protein
MLQTTPNRTLPQLSVFIGAFAVVATTGFFLLLYWNHFVGLKYGAGHIVVSSWLLRGILPYKDYFAPMPFFSILANAGVLALFGKSYIVVRVFAVFIRIAIALVVYFWLRQMFRPSHAALAASLTAILGSCDITDPLDSYNHQAILLSILSGLAASFALDPNKTSKSLTVLGIFSGVCAALCFFTKQTVGFGTTIVIPVVVAVLLSRLASFSKAKPFLLGYCAGWGLSSAMLILWLIQNGIWQNFIQQIFVKGPAAKASHPTDLLFRFVYFTVRFSFVTFEAILAVVFTWFMVQRSAHKESLLVESNRPVVFVLMLGVFAVGLGAFAHWHLPLWFQQGFDFIAVAVTTKIIMYLALFASFVQCLYYALLWLRRIHFSGRQAQFCLYAAISFIDAGMICLSYPAYEVMIIPGFGLILAAALDVAGQKGLRVIYAIWALLLFGATANKLFCSFNGEPPIRTANTTSALPQLAGLVLPESTVRFIDSSVKIIQSNSSPQDTIFVYPEGSEFYYLTNRMCATFSLMHNIDVMNDQFAKAEAARLWQKKPAVLIYCPDSALKQMEEFWRHGHQSGNRDIESVCQALAKRYHLAATFSAPGMGVTSVYVRPNPQEKLNGRRRSDRTLIPYHFAKPNPRRPLMGSQNMGSQLMVGEK